MIPINKNDLTYFFSIVHVTKQPPDQLLYGVLINWETHYLAKTINVENLEPGTYIATVTTGSTRRIARIIVQ